LAQVPENRIPAATEILPHRDVILEAIGGNGEPGGRGGDGQSGLDGVPGRAATREQDATVSLLSLNLGVSLTSIAWKRWWERWQVSNPTFFSSPTKRDINVNRF